MRCCGVAENGAVLSVRVPASVGVSTAQPRLTVCVAPRPCTYALRSRIATHESDVVISDHHRHRHRRIARGERCGESEACPDQQQDQHHQVARPVRTHVRRRQRTRPGVYFSTWMVEEGGGVVGEVRTVEAVLELLCTRTTSITCGCFVVDVLKGGDRRSGTAGVALSFVCGYLPHTHA